jgi:hypothetical protein
LREGRDAASLGGTVFMIVADRNFEDDRNRFILFGLYSVMKLFLAFFVLMTAQAMSLKDFNTKAETDKTVDLSKLEFEQVVVLNTAEKFKIQVPADFQRTGDPSVKPRPAAPNLAPPPNPATAPADDDDPIGAGGFITPPTVAVMQICVSADFASSWENPSAGPEMADFRGIIGDYILHNGKNGEQFRLKDSAYGTFESARQAAPSRTPLPNSLIDRLAAGQRCPSTDRVYNVQRKPPAK